jgi:hypothetical protein
MKAWKQKQAYFHSEMQSLNEATSQREEEGR